MEAPPAAPRGRSKQTLANLTGAFGPGVLRAWFATLRLERIGDELFDETKRQAGAAIFAFWHGNQFVFAHTHRRRGIHVLVSKHADGELIARPLSRLGFVTVRGSTTRGGSAALRKLVRIGRKGHHLAITPDGPKGPRHRVQAGVITLARLTGLPILTGSWAASRTWEIDSWDGFRVPKPFTRIVTVMERTGILVPRDAGPDEEERCRVQLEDALLEGGRRAERYLRDGVLAAGGNGA